MFGYFEEFGITLKHAYYAWSSFDFIIFVNVKIPVNQYIPREQGSDSVFPFAVLSFPHLSFWYDYSYIMAVKLVLQPFLHVIFLACINKKGIPLFSFIRVANLLFHPGSFLPDMAQCQLCFFKYHARIFIEQLVSIFRS
jgi:hypothetical protein